jgi:hypothetical protein
MNRARPCGRSHRRLRGVGTAAATAMLSAGLAYFVAPATASAASPRTTGPTAQAASRAFQPLLPGIAALQTLLAAQRPAARRAVTRADLPRAGVPRRLPASPPRPATSFAHVYTVDTAGDATVSTPSPTEAMCASGNAHTCTLRQAVADAGSDTGHVDEVVVPSGTHVVLSLGTVAVAGSMVIAGAGASVNADRTGSVFTIGAESFPSVEIDGLLVTGGLAPSEGGGIDCESSALVLSGVNVSANIATSNDGGLGGGIYVGEDCQMWLDGSLVDRNLAIGGGLSDAPTGATAAAQGTGYGGGIFVDGSASISHTSIDSNVAATGGGVFDNGEIVASATTVDSNTVATGEPGTGVGVANNGTLDISDSHIDHNDAPQGAIGGGLFNDATASLSDTTVSANSIEGSTEGSCVDEEVELDASACGTGIASAPDEEFGEDFEGGSLDLTNVVLDDNSAHLATNLAVVGGAIFCVGCSLSFDGGTIAGTVNVAPSDNEISDGVVGGAMLLFPIEDIGGARPRQEDLFGQAIVKNVAISGTVNGAPGGEVVGGAVTSLGFESSFDRVSISGTHNVASEIGGGVLLAEEGPVQMDGVAISSTSDHASYSAGDELSSEVLGGVIADVDGLEAMTLDGVSIDGTSVVADLGTTKTPSTLESFVGGGAILELPIEAVGSVVTNGLAVEGTSVVASGGDGVVAGGAIATLGGQADLQDTEVLGTTVQADDVVAGGLVANGLSGLVATNVTLGNSSVKVLGGKDATFAPPGVFGGAFLNISGSAEEEEDASAVVTNGTVGAVSVTAPSTAGSYASVVEVVGACSGDCTNGGIQLTNTTIGENRVSAPSGAAATLAALDGTVGLRNSIVTATAPAVACTAAGEGGAIGSAGYNIDTGHTCGFTAPGDHSDTSPMLLPLADNGGAVETEALTPPFYGPFVPGSPAIDAGSNVGCPATDARGEARPQDGTCDIGAYELAAQGYWMTARDGGLFHFGAGHFFGSVVALQQRGLVGPLQGPIVGVAATADHRGYFQAGDDGGVFAFGDARFGGSLARLPLAARIVGVATDATGDGYWTVGAEGRVSAFGDAVYHGSEDYQVVHEPVVGIAATHDGLGYWLATSDGHVLAFGDAPSLGSPAASGIALASPLVAIVTTPGGSGYWLFAADGGVFSYGDARFHGSMGGKALNEPIVAAAATPDGLGYWLFASDGGVFNFGDARFLGSMASTPITAPVSGAASSNA